MEGNKDEALRCLQIAQKHRDAGNFSAARKFAQKSISLYETPGAAKLLASINEAAAAGADSTPEPSTSATGTETHPLAGGAKHRHASASSSATANGGGSSNGTAGGMGGEKREYTEEQHKVVKRVRAYKVTEYYEILAIKKDCEEAEIKKAYRKVRRRVWCATARGSQIVARAGITSGQEWRTWGGRGVQKCVCWRDRPTVYLLLV